MGRSRSSTPGRRPGSEAHRSSAAATIVGQLRSSVPASSPSDVHEQLASQVVDVEEHLADAAHVARGHRDLVDVEELLVDVGVRQAQVSSQGRGLPG